MIDRIASPRRYETAEMRAMPVLARAHKPASPIAMFFVGAGFGIVTVVVSLAAMLGA